MINPALGSMVSLDGVELRRRLVGTSYEKINSVAKGGRELHLFPFSLSLVARKRRRGCVGAPFAAVSKENHVHKND